VLAPLEVNNFLWDKLVGHFHFEGIKVCASSWSRSICIVFMEILRFDGGRVYCEIGPQVIGGLLIQLYVVDCWMADQRERCAERR